MNRIGQTFKRLKQEQKKAFIPYITAGDPDIKTTKSIISALVNAGSDIIELGVPFSDPLADGPTIQRAIQRSLASGCSVGKVFGLVKDIRCDFDIPIVFMTYYNIVFNYGINRFVKDAKKAGVDGIIVPDLPMEESKELICAADKQDFYVIMLTAPTTPLERFERITGCSRGFVYYVSLTGVTGERKALSSGLKSELKELRKVSTKPLCVGFGISTALQAKNVACLADGVIVGSALIKIIEQNLNKNHRIAEKVGKFAKTIADAVHNIG
ncbi:MAG: tryptophan synthase subunit alpha [Candidatus Omnitrophota bacterium]